MTRSAWRTGVIAVWLLVVCVAGCGTSSPSSAPNSVASASPIDVAPTTPALIASRASTEASASTSSPVESRAATVTAGTVAATIVDGLRVRSQPRIGNDSFKFEPLLPLGAKMYVLDGPVVASGYPWYEVAPLTSKTFPSGWVASTDRDGARWIESASFDCPQLPADLHALATLPAGVGLACFPRMPITVQARLIECMCDVDGSWYTPSWFFLGSGGPQLLVEPDAIAAAVPANPDDWFVLNLDPDGEKPAVLPIGGLVEVTGIYDHPAAASCTRTDMDGEPAPSQGCRLEFAVTKLVPRP
jgi:hypothetical protein